MSTKIEWVTNPDGTPGETWNPVVGCSRVTEGCRHCYAERMARRLQAMGLPQYQDTINENGRWSGVLNWAEKAGDLPLRQTKPRTYFVNSMSDLFHESISVSWLVKIWDIMCWIIAGGESGPKARQMHPDWARAIRDQAQAAQIPFFFKQMSKKAAIPDDLLIREMPEFSKCT
ncbi:MAG: DUF5131 family protein [Peptococcaceae bacterium]|jgi:protein gp37|nr:MAG: DUF5131 family protein [Peptococcaceae bacterium]